MYHVSAICCVPLLSVACPPLRCVPLLSVACPPLRCVPSPPLQDRSRKELNGRHILSRLFKNNFWKTNKNCSIRESLTRIININELMMTLSCWWEPCCMILSDQECDDNGASHMETRRVPQLFWGNLAMCKQILKNQYLDIAAGGRIFLNRSVRHLKRG